MNTNTEVHSIDNPSDQLSVGYDLDDVYLVCLHSAGDRMVSMDPEEAYSLAVFLEWLTDPTDTRETPSNYPPSCAAGNLLEQDSPAGPIRSVNIVIANEEDAEVVGVRLTVDDANSIAEALYRGAVHAAWIG